jgi:PAS domain S-box-containing protein
MKGRLRILHLEDDPGDALLVRETLEADGVACQITRVDTEAAFVASLAQDELDLVLADYTLPAFDGLYALKLARQVRVHVPFIFVSGTLGEDVAIDALKIGATDYVFKTRLSRLVPSVRRALREAEERMELIRAEDALKRSEAFLAEGQRLSQAGSFGWTVSSGDIYWSRETFRIYDVDPTATVTMPLVMQRVHPDDRPALRALIEGAAREGTHLDYEHRLLLPDGSVKHVHVIAHPVTDAAGRFGYIGAIQDVTRQRQADEALRHAQTELARVTRLTTMGELTASLAHEINQPLTAIMANSLAGLRWLARDTPDLVEVQNAFHHIVRDATRAGGVIRGIRDFAMKAGPQLDRLDVDEVIEEVLALTRGELHRQGVALHTDLTSGGRSVLGDRVQLQQVLLNLILNGIDAMKPVMDRARELTVSTAFRAPVDLVVAVEDTGIGLDPDVAQRIFDPFFTTKADGLGIGLSICRSIVGAHGGRLWASPRAPCGTTLRFTIPLAG